MKKIIIGIILAIISVMSISQNTFAENVDTSRLQFNAMPYNSNDYNWTSELLYNQDIYGLKYARLFRFKTANFTTTGTNAVIHFETKIDYYQPQAPFKDPFVNLDYMHVQACSFNDGSNLEILGENVLYLKKYETYQGGAYGVGEITFYGDVALKGFTPNQNGYLKCMIGSFDYAFMSTGATSYNSNATSFVNNYINITMSDNVANELLAQQIAQTQQMLAAQQQIINQNQQIINAQNETNEWLKDSTPPSVDTSSLGSSAGWMPPGPVDSILTLPLQLLQGIVNVFTNTNCSPLQVPVPYVNEEITLPCVSTLMDDIGFTPVWNIVGGVISAVIIWDTLKWLYRFVDDTLTFRENNSGMWGGL